MKQNISDRALKEILGTELADNDMIDARIEETYAIIRGKAKKKGQGERKKAIEEQKQTAGKRTVKKRRTTGKRIAIGFGSAAAVIVCMFTFCVMNPVMAQEIPFLGSLFEKVADVFPFGRLPEEDTAVLYSEAEKSSENTGADDVQSGSGGDVLYQKTDGDITITLTEEYASNQAVYIGIRIENKQEFPEMVSYANGAGTQLMQVWTKENYSFRPDQIQGARKIEGKFEDAHTFIGIMRIDYSDIDVNDSLYAEACQEAEAKGEELPTVDGETWDLYMSQYDIPDTFDMELEITRLKGYLKNPTRPEYLKSDEDLEQMTDAEWEAYMNTLPSDWMDYQYWKAEGSWAYQLPIIQKDEAARVITINETNADGIGFESLELSSVEMTLNTIEPNDASTIAIALDADGRQLESGSQNFYELSIAEHDISTVYLYICDYDEYMDEFKGCRLPGNPDYDNYQSILEERALFKTVVNTTE